jgi:hypothetical protein
MIDIDTRLRAARGIAKTETEASIQVFQTLKRRGHPDAPPPTISDGWGGIDDAMVEVYGVVPEYQGIGRPPTLKRPQPGWQYVQVVKQRENGRVEWTRSRCQVAGHFWRRETSVGPARKKHGVHRTHPSHHAAL